MASSSLDECIEAWGHCKRIEAKITPDDLKAIWKFLDVTDPMITEWSNDVVYPFRIEQVIDALLAKVRKHD